MGMITTKLRIQDSLPLTCSRGGTCCHGNTVLLNPWELARLAQEKKNTPREFRDLYCDFGGIRLRFDGAEDFRKKPACSQYSENFGCSVHAGRPLSCRLFPLGRQIQNEVVNYIFQGNQFPCLNGCPEVLELPHLTVGEYLEGQITDTFEIAQDHYLEFMQNSADISFIYLLDTGLAKSGDKKTLQIWREMGDERPEMLSERIGAEWIDFLMIPEIMEDLEDPISFAAAHYHQLEQKVQEKFGDAQTNQELHEASVTMMGIALYLARGIGANPKNLSEHWIDVAKKNGALE